MNNLHPGAKWLFRIQTYFIALFLSIFVGWFIVPAIVFIATILFKQAISTTFIIILLSVLFYIIIVVILSEIYVQMAYNRWLYEFTDEGLRLERGVIWKRYSNVPYERIQNVDIHRGIIARMFGFSSLMIQTAGYSAHPYAEGYIPALGMGEAERIRAFVMKKITRRH